MKADEDKTWYNLVSLPYGRRRREELTFICNGQIYINQVLYIFRVTDTQNKFYHQKTALISEFKNTPTCFHYYL